MKQTKFAKALALSTGVLVFSVSASCLIFALPWTPPSAPPPDGNVDAPINTGDDAQGKLGHLGIGTTSPEAKLDIADNGAAAGAQFLRIGDDTFLTDIDIANTLGIYSQGDNTIASIKLGNNGGIISGRNNNIGIGIGADSPNGTLYVARGTANGGTAVFAGTDNKSHFNYSVDEDTYIRGGKANSKVIINDNGGNVGIGTASPTQKLDVNGYVKGRDGLCIGEECCSTWKECVELSGVTPSLPGGAENKRIFVTGRTYTANEVGNRANADTLCQKHADGAGLPGTFKALIYFCTTGYSPYTGLPSRGHFWNCSTSECVSVAGSPVDLFTKDGSGNYLENPIKYDEVGGAPSNPVTVWTGFTPDGSGGWTGQLCSPSSPWGLCYTPSGGTSYTIHGSSFSKDIGWARFANASYGNVSTCLSQSRALYCVEQ